MRFLFTAVFVLLISCKGQEDPAVAVSQTKSIGVQSFLHESSSVPVCFESYANGFDEYQSLMEQVRDTVTSAFGGTVVRFTGWGICGAPNNNGIRIALSRIEDTSFGVSDVGKDRTIKKLMDPMVFGSPSADSSNFDPTMVLVWGDNDVIKNELNNTYDLKRESGFVLLHEFGHAIGFLHEHIRSETCVEEETVKSTLSELNVEETDLFMSSKYDPTSIMDYCNMWDSMDDPSKTAALSNTDIEFINRAYSDK